MMYRTAQSKKEGGFTLIEVMIAMAIFTVIVTIGIGSVLSAIRQHHVSEDSRTVIDNLNFLMEDMARNVRLGMNVHCMASGEAPLSFTDDYDAVPPQDCALPGDAHNAIVFNDQSGRQLTYAISTGLGGAPSQVYKQRGSADAVLVNPPEVEMDFAKSGFTVRGSLPGDGAQPIVTIRLVGKVVYKSVNTIFSIQHTVTLRNVDS